jgi:uncharacterized protein (DUF1501 family)
MISRRNFLKQSLAVVSLGVAVPSVFGRAVLAAAAERGSAPPSGKTLIVVQLAGGVDGLNTVIPYRDSEYRRLRPSLAVPDNQMIAIDDRYAFHSSFARMKDIFDAGRLAVVQGVGYPNPNFSHFKAMDIWQTADPDGQAREGWLGRYFEGLTDADGHPLSGLNIGRSLPTAFRSDKASIASLESLETFGLQSAAGDGNPEARQTSLMRLYDIYRPANTPFAALLDTTFDDASLSATQLATVHAAYKPAVTYPQSSLASGLRLLAELIDAGGDVNPLRVGHVTIGGFDTHTQQPGRLSDLLRETSEGIHAFWNDIEGHGHAGDVMIMTWSEFGRRVPENGQAGTDHGSAGPMFIVGSAVKGGFHGDPPNLANLDNGNLVFTTDFRSVYATVLERWLQAPAADVLAGRFDQLSLLAT